MSRPTTKYSHRLKMKRKSNVKTDIEIAKKFASLFLKRKSNVKTDIEIAKKFASLFYRGIKINLYYCNVYYLWYSIVCWCDG